MFVFDKLDFSQLGSWGLVKGYLHVGLRSFEYLKLEKAMVKGRECFKVLFCDKKNSIDERIIEPLVAKDLEHL